MQDDKHYLCIISGKCLFFEWPAGTIKPILYGCWDVFGCGLVLSPDEKLAIFFTTNGVLMGKLSIAKNRRGEFTLFYRYLFLNTVYLYLET
jgi:hypothetical protein